MSSSLQNNNSDNNDIEEGINTNTSPSSTSVEHVPTNSPTQEQEDASHRTATVPSIHATGPELIDADDEPPLPMGMAETALDTAKDEPEREGPELIDDNIGPDHSMDIESTFADDGGASSKPLNTQDTAEPETACVEQIVDEGATPHDLTEFEEGVDTKKKAVQATATAYHEDSIRIPTREDIEGEVEFATSRVRRTWRLATTRIMRAATTQAPPRNNSNGPTNTDINGDVEDSAESIDQGDNETHVLPTAVWLPDDDVYDATPLEPTLPWWKQRRTKILLLLVIASVSALAIGLGISFSSDRTSTEVVMITTTSAPSVSTIPTIQPTTSFPSIEPTDTPSLSFVPSSTPTACVAKIYSTGTQLIEIPPPVNSFYEPLLAVDGMDMLIVATNRRLPVFHVLFYSLTNEGWTVKNAFQEGFRNNEHEHISISDNIRTALVGFNENGVLVYAKNIIGFWEKTEGLQFTRDSYVEIDGDLACAETETEEGISLFCREGKNWVQFDSIDNAYGCLITGNIIVTQQKVTEDWPIQYHLQIYTYDRDLHEIVPTQDPIDHRNRSYIYEIGLTSDYLVLSPDEETIVIYSRDETNQTYIPHQQINITRPGFNTDQLVLDDDTFVVTGIDQTHVFSNQNGYWRETITLGESYESYGLSERNLITMKYNDISELYEFNSFNIEDCTQEMPTSSPSLSIAPTSCYSIKITIQYDYFARHISFELEQISLAGDDYMIKTHQAGTEHFYNESICLQEGEYKFTIYDSGGKGCLISLAFMEVTM